MARITESNTEYESTTNSKYHSESTSKSESQSQSATRKVLDEALRDRILSGLMGTMTDEEIESRAAELARSITEQKRSYAQSAADVQTAALSRGMGRSSYTLEALANTGDRFSRAVKELTDASEQKTAQARARMALAAQQNAAPQGRLNEDYARELAAKVQELKESQRKEYNQNYLAAVSGSMVSG